ncbi:CpsD/CapB family tyrosine-protein kinase [soil metagenome]
MGRIEKALEKARQVRDQGGQPAPAFQERRRPAPVIPAESRQRRAPAHPGRAAEIFTKATVLDTDPEVLANNRIITSSRDNLARPAYKMLRTRLLQRMRANGWTSVAITAAGPGEGKTLTAINLAISLAGEVNQRVFLVDFDLRRPNISKYFGIEPQHTLADYLRGDATLEQILISPGIDRLVVVPNDTVFENSSELLSSPKIVRMVDELRVSDPSWIVIYDMPPLLAADDTLAFMPSVDALLVVIAEGQTTQEEVSQMRELLKEANIVGTVLNKSQATTASYY